MFGFCAFASGCVEDESLTAVALAPSGVQAGAPNSRVVPGLSVALPPPGPLPKFREAAAEVGIVFERYDDHSDLHRIVESTGGGAAILDFDADGRPDVFLTDGCRLPVRKADGTRTSRLFRQSGPLHFRDATEPGGLQLESFWTGTAIGDFDADGFEDLFVGGYGTSRLWRGNGDGTFADATDRLPDAPAGWSSSAAFCDLNLDGTLDLYVVNYLDAPVDPPELCLVPGRRGEYLQCPPPRFKAIPDIVFCGHDDGGFTDVTRDAGFIDANGRGLGVVVFDADRDGRPDVCVANDGDPNLLFVNETDLSADPRLPAFREQGALYGVALNEDGGADAGMGVIAADATGDGWPDIYLTHFSHQMNRFHRNLGDGRFADDTVESGLGPASLGKLGFGTQFIDFDHDGRLDIFVTNGHVNDRALPGSEEPYAMPPQFFRNGGDGFSDVSAWCGDYFAKSWVGRAAAAGDLDGDGDLDLVVSHQRSPSAVLINETEADSESVQLRLVGVGSNRSAFGAVVECDGPSHLLVRERVGGGGYQSASDPRLHIGLAGAAGLPKAVIRWPSGRAQELADLPAGDYLVVEGRPPLRLLRGELAGPKVSDTEALAALDGSEADAALGEPGR